MNNFEDFVYRVTICLEIFVIRLNINKSKNFYFKKIRTKMKI